jgi:hypothetical protein
MNYFGGWMKTLKLLLVSFMMVVANSSAFAGTKSAGTEVKLFGKMEPTAATQVKMAEVIKSFEKYKGQNIAMTGSVKKVCEMSGCWFEMADGKEAVRITMKDYGFTVPKEIINRSVKVIGVMEQKELPVKVVKHYMKDEGKSQAEIDKVTQPQKVFEFVANGVELM